MTDLELKTTTDERYEFSKYLPRKFYENDGIEELSKQYDANDPSYYDKIKMIQNNLRSINTYKK